MTTIEGGEVTFLKVTDGVVRRLRGLIGGRTLIDCGAGTGKLQLAMRPGEVVSLDLMPKAGHVLQRDCTSFEYSRGTVPIFVRPCHNSFVGRTVRKALADGAEFALYIGFEKNLGNDLGDEFDHVITRRVADDWEGSDGEQIFKVFSCYEKHILTFALVEDSYFKQRWWYELDGDRLVNFNGGWRPFGSKDTEHERTEAHDFEELDWTKTSLPEPDSDAAWLSRDGVWHGCGSEAHDMYARFVLKQEVHALEKGGWVRVYGPPDEGDEPSHQWIIANGRLTAEQRNELSRRGHDLSHDDLL